MLIQTQKKAIKMGNKIIVICLLTFTLCLLVSTFSCCSTSNSKHENLQITSTRIPDSLEVDTIEKVTINNKTIEIYIAYNIDKTETYEFWYIDNKQVHFVQYPIFDINYKWLVDLDGDNDIEIIRAQGYEDGINYGIYKKNRNSEKLVLSFNPALLDERYPDKLFWGFPWDMDGIDMKHKKQILSSFQVSDERDDNYSMAEKQKQMPYVFFYGKTTQPHFELKIEPSKREYQTLKDLIAKSFQENQSEYLIPIDSYILDSASFEINKTTYRIFSLEKLVEKNSKNDSHFGLPIIVLQNKTLLEENFDIVLSYNDNCPADGYGGIYVEGHHFTIQQTFCVDFLFVRSNATFKIDPNNNEIILDNYAEEYTDRSNLDRPIPAKRWTSKDFEKVLFRETTVSFLMKIRQTKPK